MNLNIHVAKRLLENRQNETEKQKEKEKKINPLIYSLNSYSAGFWESADDRRPEGNQVSHDDRISNI